VRDLIRAGCETYETWLVGQQELDPIGVLNRLADRLHGPNYHLSISNQDAPGLLLVPGIGCAVELALRGGPRCVMSWRGGRSGHSFVQFFEQWANELLAGARPALEPYGPERADRLQRLLELETQPGERISISGDFSPLVMSQSLWEASLRRRTSPDTRFVLEVRRQRVDNFNQQITKHNHRDLIKRPYLEQYMSTGGRHRWTAEELAQHVRHVISRLEQFERYQIALTEVDLPFDLLGKGRELVLVSNEHRLRAGQMPEIMWHTSERLLVDGLHRLFDSLWLEASASLNKAKVIEWLIRHSQPITSKA
jgi:hypothetical protein